jgi:hypothetical protein
VDCIECYTSTITTITTFRLVLKQFKKSLLELYIIIQWLTQVKLLTGWSPPAANHHFGYAWSPDDILPPVFIQTAIIKASQKGHKSSFVLDIFDAKACFESTRYENDVL